jgi:hypothetical protein
MTTLIAPSEFAANLWIELPFPWNLNRPSIVPWSGACFMVADLNSLKSTSSIRVSMFDSGVPARIDFDFAGKFCLIEHER